MSFASSETADTSHYSVRERSATCVRQSRLGGDACTMDHLDDLVERVQLVAKHIQGIARRAIAQIEAQRRPVARPTRHQAQTAQGEALLIDQVEDLGDSL